MQLKKRRDTSCGTESSGPNERTRKEVLKPEGVSTCRGRSSLTCFEIRNASECRRDGDVEDEDDSPGCSSSRLFSTGKQAALKARHWYPLCPACWEVISHDTGFLFFSAIPPTIPNRAGVAAQGSCCDDVSNNFIQGIVSRYPRQESSGLRVGTQLLTTWDAACST
jgi:hypothetical protein